MDSELSLTDVTMVISAAVAAAVEVALTDATATDVARGLIVIAATECAGANIDEDDYIEQCRIAFRGATAQFAATREAEAIVDGRAVC